MPQAKPIPAETLATIRAVFFEESDQHLADLRRGLAALQGGAAEPDALGTAVRAAHSIKGCAGFFEMAEVVRIADLVESCLAQGQTDADWLSAGALRPLLSGVDGLAELIGAEREGRAPDIVLYTGLQARLASLLETAPGGGQDREEALGFTPRPVDLGALNLDDGDA